MITINQAYIYSKHVLSGHSNRIPIFFFRSGYRLMQVKSILSTFIKLPFVVKTFVLSIFEWPLKTGFTVSAVPDGTNLKGPNALHVFYITKLVSDDVVTLTFNGHNRTQGLSNSRTTFDGSHTHQNEGMGLDILLANTSALSLLSLIS